MKNEASTLSCFICEPEYKVCPFPVCYEQEAQSKKLREEWESQKAMTQAEIQEEQLELKL